MTDAHAPEGHAGAPSPAPRRPGRRGRRRRARRLLAAAVLAALAVVAGCVTWTRAGSAEHRYDLGGVPATPVVMVLGAQVFDDGTPSPFLVARLEVARALYAAGRVRVVLLSGDTGSRPGYDEIGPMTRWLVERGVPAGRIVGDGAGFDTYDSCARARLVYRVPRMIVVTQSYHLPRAVTLCRAAGVDAIGVGDDSVRLRRFSWWKGTAREQLACVKAAYEVATRSAPVSLGPPDDAVRRALDG